MENGVHTTKEKALSLNLNERIYGTLAEIGGGQEVAANFFKAGGASGTIAKTMSAYDMTFSDAIYGATKRYVCEEKLLKMLDKEYSLLSKRLNHRAPDTHFFAFANTVETLNFKKTNAGHGWLGVRFQLTPEAEPNDLIVHIVLKDPDAIWQQEVLGRVGVNMIYACFNHHLDPEALMCSIIDNLSTDRLDIDMFRLEGPDFKSVDNRLMSLKLVKHGLTHAAMFDDEGEVQQTSSYLYKKNICVLRGQFRPVTNVHTDMIEKGLRQFMKDPGVELKDVNVVVELMLNDLTTDGTIDEQDFMDRVDLLNSLGYKVLISNYNELYELADYFAQFTRGKRLGFITGIDVLSEIFDEKRYSKIRGGIMGSFGHLFGANVKLMVFPMIVNEVIETAFSFQPPEQQRNLYEHLRVNGFIEDIEDINEEYLHIMSEVVLRQIKEGTEDWEQFVPDRVAKIIKEKQLFQKDSFEPID